MQYAIEPDEDDPSIMRVHLQGESELDDMLLATMALDEIDVLVVLHASNLEVGGEAN